MDGEDDILGAATATDDEPLEEELGGIEEFELDVDPALLDGDIEV